MTGPLRAYHQDLCWAARVAEDELNERGGLLGRRLEVVLLDEGATAEAAVTQATRALDEQGCFALVGCALASARTAVVRSVSEPRHVPFLSYSPSEGSTSGRYFFQLAGVPSQQIEAIIPWAIERLGPRVFLCGNELEWTRGSLEAAKRALLSAGGELVGEAYFPAGTPVFTEILQRLAKSGANTLVTFSVGDDQQRFLEQYAESGLKQRLATIVGQCSEATVCSLAPHVREGLYTVNSYFMTVESPEAHAYLERLAGLPGVNGLWPRGNGLLTHLGESAYVCLQALAAAVRASGSTSAEPLRQALETVEVSGPQGRVSMVPALHHATQNSYLARCEADGTFRVLHSLGSIPPQLNATNPSHGARQAPGASSIGMTARRHAADGSTLDLVDVAVISTDTAGRILTANERATREFGYPRDGLIGLSVEELVPPRFRGRHAEHMARFIASSDTVLPMSGRGPIYGYRRDGSEFAMEASISRGRANDTDVLVMTLRDLTQQLRVGERLRWEATHDPLTGLPNRELIRERLAAALARTQRGANQVALLFIDIDDFKLINDSYGHAVGDLLIREIAERLVFVIRGGDIVGRVGGDEFVVIAEQLTDDPQASQIAERISTALRRPFVLDGKELFVTVSIGIMVGSGATHDVTELIRDADRALSHAKDRGRDGWQMFDARLRRQSVEYLELTNGLRRALGTEQLVPFFQPVVSVPSGKIIGAELLIRWRHPELGDVSPARFIPHAESSGLIVPLGAWVFEEACRAQVRWAAMFPQASPVGISVNVSPRQLSDRGFEAMIRRTLERTHANPRHLVLELTETTLMTDVDANLRLLNALGELGLKIAVDDFGTGYSSLGHLKRLPIDSLKIDRLFIDGIERSPESRAIVAAIIAMAHTLELKVVAEGVETAAQLQELTTLSCDFAQGYFFCRPVPAAQLEAVLSEGGPAGR